ncbi:MAG: SusD/RagB family nutrient-binding outer membrane lipoprotein, partial [Lewinella sp.]|nr:SusD/RagB family nutrient-binding outer membrane lipoprotein [Lewinella sp.]
IDLNTDETTKADALSGGSNANQIAVARIMKSYFFNVITDAWGPVPYSEALQGRALFNPSYDDQQAIYSGLFSELKGAVAQMDGGPGVEGDFLLGGDMAMWAKFANTLRMVYALRLSEVDEGTAKSEFTDALSAGVIGEGEDVMYPYLAETANQNPWYADFITRTDWAISLPLVDVMKPLNDPRLSVYADPAPNYGDVRGMPYGIIDAGDIPNDEISFPGFPAVRGQNAPLAIVTSSQVLFSMAEAAVRGWISDDAEQLYYDAIKASMERWGVYDDATFNTYIAQADVAWDANNAMELIATQKWIALYTQGYEAWAEWRRLDMPVLTPAPDALNQSKEIPVRYGYPTTERDANGTSYEAGLVLLGGEDGLDTHLWWDVR